MHGTLTQKVGRIVCDFALHPNYVPRYVTTSLLPGQSPLDMEIPWFSYSAIDFLDNYLSPEMSVCEYGSGGSTLFFARRVKSVFSIEDNSEWFTKVQTSIREKGVTNAEITFAPFNFKDPTDFENSAYLHSIPDQKFDVIVVDGAEEWIPVRPTCFHHAEKYIKRGGIIVVDDSWRYVSLRENSKARDVRVFESVGPCRPGVTSTDIYFY
jgi:predicted O-methyltransferase YrrM